MTSINLAIRRAWHVCVLVVVTLGCAFGANGSPSSIRIQPIKLWQHTYPGIIGVPSADGLQLTGVQGDKVFSVNLETGQTVWQRDLSSYRTKQTGVDPSQSFQLFAPVIMPQGVVVAVTDDARARATGYVLNLDRSTGKTKWIYTSVLVSGGPDTRGGILSPPALWRDRIIFRTGRGLTALRATDGKEIWNVPFDPNGSVPLVLSAQPVGDDHALYFNADYGIAYSFDPLDGHIIWSRPTKGFTFKQVANVTETHFTFSTCSPLRLQDKIIVADGLSTIYAMRASDGALLWEANTGYAFKLSAVGGDLYVGTHSWLWKLDAATGAVLRNYLVPNGIMSFVIEDNNAIVSRYLSGWGIISLQDWQATWLDPKLSVSGITQTGNLMCVSGYVNIDQHLGGLRVYKVPGNLNEQSEEPGLR